MVDLLLEVSKCLESSRADAASTLAAQEGHREAGGSAQGPLGVLRWVFDPWVAWFSCGMKPFRWVAIPELPKNVGLLHLCP